QQLTQESSTGAAPPTEAGCRPPQPRKGRKPTSQRIVHGRFHAVSVEDATQVDKRSGRCGHSDRPDHRDVEWFKARGPVERDPLSCWPSAPMGQEIDGTLSAPLQ